MSKAVDPSPLPSRREVLKLGAAAAGSFALVPAASTSTARSCLRRASVRPHNVIFMVSDGMSAGVPSLAEPFSQLVRDRGTWWNMLARRPGTAHGWQETASLDSPVTDSGAASCAWATGTRIFNGWINMLPDGRALTPIAPLARSTGCRVGLVTTTRITHATPAGFASVVPRREMEDEIAAQYLDQVDVLLGGGAMHFAPDQRRDREDLLSRYCERDYVVARHRAKLLALEAPARMLGLFDRSHLPYAIDQAADERLQRRVPTLAEMTRAALRSLARHEGGFLLQVEGGRVDHAAHVNDAPALLWDQLAFDDALEVVLEFTEEHPDTLVIVTSDHGNANPGLNGMGARYRGSTEAFARLAGATTSHESMVASIRLRRPKDEAGHPLPIADEQVRGVVEPGMGLTLTNEEIAQITASLNGDHVDEPYHAHANFHGLLGQMAGNHTGIGWTSLAHTSDLVMSLATGPGREHFTGHMHNARFYDRLADLMGITHRNPNMTPEEAASFDRSIRSDAEAPARPHWA